MNSHITRRFRESFRSLPASVQQQARTAFKLFLDNPDHPSLHFKPLQGHPKIFSVRIGRTHRALAEVSDSEINWFWIGSHAEYDQFLRRL